MSYNRQRSPLIDIDTDDEALTYSSPKAYAARKPRNNANTLNEANRAAKAKRSISLPKLSITKD